MNLTIAFTQSYINFIHTVHFILYSVFFYTYSTGEELIQTAFTVHQNKLFKKGVSKVYFHALTVEGYNVSNMYKKYILNLCNHTNFHFFTCTFSKKLPVKVEGIIHKK